MATTRTHTPVGPRPEATRARRPCARRTRGSVGEGRVRRRRRVDSDLVACRRSLAVRDAALSHRVSRRCQAGAGIRFRCRAVEPLRAGISRSDSVAGDREGAVQCGDRQCRGAPGRRQGGTTEAPICKTGTKVCPNRSGRSSVVAREWPRIDKASTELETIRSLRGTTSKSTSPRNGVCV